MKCYLFVPTGEFRTPKKNEWFFGDNIFLQVSTNYHESVLYDIYICQEIDIPVPMKPKVKKWRWAIPTKKQTRGMVTGYLTEAEVKKYYQNQKWYHKIPETETEEDE